MLRTCQAGFHCFLIVWLMDHFKGLFRLQPAGSVPPVETWSLLKWKHGCSRKNCICHLALLNFLLLPLVICIYFYIYKYFLISLLHLSSCITEFLLNLLILINDFYIFFFICFKDDMTFMSPLLASWQLLSLLVLVPVTRKRSVCELMRFIFGAVPRPRPSAEILNYALTPHCGIVIKFLFKVS